MTRCLAVDIGTTTVELALVEESGHSSMAVAWGKENGCSTPGKVEAFRGVKRVTIANPQRLYGSDVLSRMNNAVTRGLAKTMQTQIRSAIMDTAFSAFSLSSWQALSSVVLSGNTLMLHLFHGLDTSGMLTAPFTPAQLAPPAVLWDGVPVLSMPAVSAFVGGDILSGLYASFSYPFTAPLLFADLGTNGELALCTPDGILVTSVAAGPAFEGGNLSIGMPAISGAIDSVTIKNGFCRIHTIDGSLPPRGLCGSGLTEAVAELLQDGLLDRHGSFVHASHRENGFALYAQNASQRLTLTQDDIRAFQVAKGAFRAGIDALLRAAGLPMSAIHSFVLAGSFGSHLDSKKASSTGLIPKALLSRTVFAGNASLAGAIRLSRQPDDYPRLTDLCQRASHLSLADSAAFKEAYLRYMDF